MVAAVLLATFAWPTSGWAGAPDETGDHLVAEEAAANAPAATSRDRAERTGFVLAEVRRAIESNPANKVLSLSIDPDYRGGKDTFLVNVILTTQERETTLGVIVTCRPASQGWKSELAFVE
jgi:hypothetical protein